MDCGSGNVRRFELASTVRYVALFLGFLVVYPIGWSHAETPPSSRVDRPPEAFVDQWAESDAWLGLLYFQREGKSYRSDTQDPKFFLSPQGQRSPQTELLASLEEMAKPQPQGNEHPQCRFPARFAWLRSLPSSPLAAAEVQECPGFSAFQHRIAARSVSMIFPEPNMDDVSTLFGHSFLHFKRVPAGESELTEDYSADDYTLNFAARLAPGMKQSDLLKNWLTGPLDGIFTMTPYGKKLQDYLQTESRDIWEYQLNLNQEETDQLVRHAWELRGTDFEYSFFLENCAYRMLNFLDVARPGLNLHRKYALYAAPLDTIETVIAAGMVTRADYRPSELTQRLAQGQPIKKPLEPGKVGHYSARVIVAGGAYEGNPIFSARIRASYHDFLDAPSGGPLAAISALEVAARQIDGRSAQLTDFTAFSLTSIKPHGKDYAPWSWRFSAGITGLYWEPEDVKAQQATQLKKQAAQRKKKDEPGDWVNPLYANLLIGPAWGGRNFAMYQLFGAEVQVDAVFRNNQAPLAVWNPGIIARSRHWQAQLEAWVYQPLDGDRDAYGRVSASLSRGISAHSMLFLRATHEQGQVFHEQGVQLGMGFYF
ncbi:Hypothetical protein HDN1F_05760 [gamma proteobacterium HdN1]|nr:Hypothetical protein HDN1F_05760 [gamma proteobacterium HdN1]